MKAITSSFILFLLTTISLSSGLSTVTLQSGQTMRERILSEDFSIANKALEENKKLKDIQAVCLSIENPFLEIKRQAAEALGKFKDRAATQCLVRGLESNRVELLGGSEVVGLQVAVNRSIISALEAITGLTLPASPRPTPIEITKIKARINQWLLRNKQKH
jgi:hypothetical protein